MPKCMLWSDVTFFALERPVTGDRLFFSEPCFYINILISFIYDNNPVNGQNYYYLKQTGFDSNEEYLLFSFG